MPSPDLNSYSLFSAAFGYQDLDLTRFIKERAILFLALNYKWVKSIYVLMNSLDDCILGFAQF